MESNNVALVTGATRGIGKGVALSLAEAGYDIAFCYRQSEEQAKEVIEAIEAKGRKAFARKCDVSNFESVLIFVEQIETEFGPIEVLVNNAGITKDQALLRMDINDWQSVIETNLNSVFNFCRASIFEFLKRKRGKIINISSVSGVYGNPGQVNYSASKAGVIGFSKSLSKEVGMRGINVNVVAPGFIATDMTDDVSEKALAKAIGNTSLRRLGSVEDVCGIVTFLASDQASFITGQTICVDGGLSI